MMKETMLCSCVIGGTVMTSLITIIIIIIIINE